MTALIFIPALFIALLGFALSRRAAYYRKLERQLAATLATGEPHQRFSTILPDFSKRIAVIEDVLPEAHFSSLRGEVLSLASVERSYVPTHKKGGTIAYSSLIAHAPSVTRLYHSEVFQGFIARLTGVALRPTPLYDQSSLSLLIYDEPGDHIDWHYDYNFYRGRHFTVLLPILNSGHGRKGLSHAELSAKIDGTVCAIDTPPNSLIIFEGANVLHKVSPIQRGERRILLSMTFCADPRATWAQEIARRLKDTAFFGVRALWT